jgi:hypothetical protein
MSLTPEQYLIDKGYKLRGAPGQWQTACPFCDDKARSGGHLYVNREHGAWMCQRCQEKGSFYGLQVKLGDTPEPYHKELADKRTVWADAVPIMQNALIEEDPSEMLTYLKGRGLTAQTIGKYKLGLAGKQGIIDNLVAEGYSFKELKAAGLFTDYNGKDVPLFWNRLMIPYYQRGHVVAIRGKSIGRGTIQAKNTSIQLFGTDNLLGHKEVYICEGEMDAMLLDQLGYPACAIPGAGSFQEHWKPWFEAATRVFVVLDADEAGDKGAFRIKGMLGEKAKIVELPIPEGEESTDIGEYFQRDKHTKKEFNAMISEVRGNRLHTFEDSLIDLATLQAKHGVHLGWRDLDLALTGLLPGQVVTVLAKTGVGKTAFLSQVVFNQSMWQSYDKKEGGPGIPTLVLSLEQTRSEFATRLERIGRLYNPWATTDEMSGWYSLLRVNDENQVPPEDVDALVEEYIEQVGMPPRMLIVDYLGYWSRAFKQGSSKYEQVTEAVMELKRIAKKYEVTIIAPHQVSRTGDRGKRLELDHARDSGAVEETSDFVFGLYRPHENRDNDQDETGPWRQRADVRLEVLKSRHGNVGKETRMYWAPYSLAMVAANSSVDSRVQKEWNAFDKHFTYEQVIPVLKGKSFA